MPQDTFFTNQLNAVNSQYSGLIAIAGILLAVLSLLVAVYFYYNPRQPSYRVSYKTFFPGLFSPQRFTRLRRFLMSRPENSEFEFFVDIWNSGKETISSDVVREPLAIALQPSASEKGASIITRNIASESHPSCFSLRDEGDRIVIDWKYFDPGMAVRIRVKTTHSIGQDDVAVYGTGRRLASNRARSLDERAKALQIFCGALAVSVPIGLFCFTAGKAIDFASRFEGQGIIGYIIAIPATIAILVLIVISAGAGFAISEGLTRLFNTRSPIEAKIGTPDFEVREVLSKDRLSTYLAQLSPPELEMLLERIERQRGPMPLEFDAQVGSGDERHSLRISSELRPPPGGPTEAA